MDNNSFWELISKHRIEIPVIQRDYAQGRDTKKSAAIRTAFIESILNSLVENGKSLHLNFIYGKIKGIKNPEKIETNKKAIETMLNAVEGYSKSLDLIVNYTLDDQEQLNTHRTTFIPLDGQQRLSTLFLFHLYLFKRLDDREKLKTLVDFSYLIRPSTKQFCIELINNKLSIVTNQSITESVKDSSWFFLYWLKDPTVKGMLTTLDEIHKQCGGYNTEQLLMMIEKLTSENETDFKPISFELLNLDELKLTDKLYVKMNSRGKQLTVFENFKSWLIEHIKENKYVFSIDDWEIKLDTTWSDLFWKYKDNSNMLIDEEIFRFFRNMMQIYFIFNNIIDNNDKKELEKLKEENKEKTKEEIEAIIKGNIEISNLLANNKVEGEYVYLNNSEYASFGVLSQESIEVIFSCLDLFSTNKNDTIGKIFQKFVTGNMGLAEKVLFYVMYQFLKNIEPSNLNEQLVKLNRVYKNLINNSEIDSIIIVKNILKGATLDAQYFCDIYKNIENKKMEFKGFRRIQIKEEQLKACLLLNGHVKWKKLIDNAESHTFFNGQIGFIFNLTGIDSTCIQNEIEEQHKLEKFKKYFDVVSNLFSENFLENDKKTFLFERALLTYNDYLYRSGKYRNGSRKTFWKLNKERDNSWHRIQREYNSDSNSDYHIAWKVFQSLVNELIDGNITLQEICDNYSENDWRTCFIKYPDTIEKCGTYKHFIKDLYNQIYLLSKSDRGSDYCELESFYLYKSELENNAKLFNPFTNTEYYSCKNKDGYPCAVVDNYCITEGFKLAIDIRYFGYKIEHPWEIRLFSRGQNIKIIPTQFKNVIENSLRFSYQKGTEENEGSSGYFRYLENNVKHFEITKIIKEIGYKLKTYASDR